MFDKKVRIFSAFSTALEKHNMLCGESGILLGYSGGADSSLLLHMLANFCRERGIYLHALHVNHGIRGDEADRDEEFCREQCAELGVDFTALKGEIPALSRESGRGIEEEARAFRYSAFAEFLKKNPKLTCIATAHNADDNAETILFNLARGSGSAGLCGIPPVREFSGIKIIRPLIYISNSDIREYCDDTGIKYIFDSTNSDDRYKRNYIRHKIMPHLSELNPKFLWSMGRSADNLRIDRDYMDKAADAFLSDKAEGGVVICDDLKNVHPAILYRVLSKLYSMVSAATLEWVHLDALMRLVVTGKNGSSVSLPDKKAAVLNKGRLYFIEDKRDEVSFKYELHHGINQFENHNFAVLVGKISENSSDLQKYKESLQNIYKLSIHALVNSAKINHMLTVRSREAGDSYRFGGMTRRLKQLYNSRGYTKEYRCKNPIFCDGSGIIWVPGFPVSDRVSGDDLEIIYYYN